MLLCALPLSLLFDCTGCSIYTRPSGLPKYFVHTIIQDNANELAKQGKIINVSHVDTLYKPTHYKIHMNKHTE